MNQAGWPLGLDRGAWITLLMGTLMAVVLTVVSVLFTKLTGRKTDAAIERFIKEIGVPTRESLKQARDTLIDLVTTLKPLQKKFGSWQESLDEFRKSIDRRTRNTQEATDEILKILRSK